MGSFPSKASRLAGTTATKRKYPQHVPSASATAPHPQRAGGTASSAPSSSSPANLKAGVSKPEVVVKAAGVDASDPEFARSLRALGPVAPPLSTQSPTTPASRSPANPALRILAARSRLAAEAEREFARAARHDDAARRRFVDVATLKQVLGLRDELQVPGHEIERRLGLASGVVGVLGPKGVAGNVAGPV